MTDKIDGAVRGLRELKSAFNMRGANATTIERVVSTIYTLKADRDKWRDAWMTSAHEEAEAYRERDEALDRAEESKTLLNSMLRELKEATGHDDGLIAIRHLVLRATQAENYITATEESGK